MKRNGCLVLVSALGLLCGCLGCGAPPLQKAAADAAKTCIQGKVWMKSPVDSKQVPYAGVSVNVWRQDKNLPLVEAKTDGDGNYCVEIPVGEYRVDLRVWGMERIEGKGYLCEGSVQDVDPGKTSKKCGEDCFKADIATQCEERTDRRIGG